VEFGGVEDLHRVNQRARNRLVNEEWFARLNYLQRLLEELRTRTLPLLAGGVAGMNLSDNLA
jgi:hypothetical protein